jgi:hypothetical protein
MADIQDGPEEAQASCPICDKPNRTGQKFCRHCGASIAAAAAPSTAISEIECLTCGTANKASAKFCRACGESLAPAIAAEPELESGPVSEPDQTPAQQAELVPEPEQDATASWLRGAWVENGAISLLKRKTEDAAASPEGALAVSWVTSLLKRKAKATLVSYLIVGTIGLLVIIGGGYALRSAMAGSEGTPEMATTVETAANEMASDVPASTSAGPATPVMQGTYAALLSDQDVVLTVIGPPSPLAQLGAIVTYSNVVTGKSCGSALEPESGHGNTSEPAAPLQFRQVTVAGQNACPRAIPVNLEISGQPVSADGIARSVQATWLNPDTGAVMMSGQLVRNAAQ